MAQVTYNEAEFRRELGRIAAFSGRALDDVVIQQSKLFTEDASGFTAPFGKAPSREGGNKKKSIGFKAVDRDIHRAFDSVRSMRIYDLGASSESGPFTRAFGKSFRKAVQKQDTHLVQFLLEKASPKFKGRRVEQSPTVELHNSMRNRRGGVTKTRSIFVLDPRAAINRYVKKIQAHVGMAKAGWNKPLQALDSQPPEWVTKHTGSVGIFFREAGDKPSVTVGNAVPYIQESAWRIESRAWNNRMRNATRQAAILERAQRKKMRELGIPIT